MSIVSLTVALPSDTSTSRTYDPGALKFTAVELLFLVPLVEKLTDPFHAFLDQV